MEAINVKVVRLHVDARLPAYAHLGPSGDLAADLYSIEDVELAPHRVRSVPTGLAFEIPENYGALIEGRSSLAAKGICTLGGVIDAGYRGEIKVVLANLTGEPAHFARGDRIAQVRFVRRVEAAFDEEQQLTQSARGHRGFGSTGR